MQSAIPFDTLEYTKGAEAVGIKREHAEYQATKMAKMIDNNFAMKNDITLLKKDIDDVRRDLKKDIEDVRKDLKKDIDDLRKDFKIDIIILRKDIENVKNELLVKLGRMMIASFSIFGVLISIAAYIFKH